MTRAKRDPDNLTPADWRRMFPRIAEVQRAWSSFVADRLGPLSITEGQVFEIIGRGLLGDRRLSSGTTTQMMSFVTSAEDLGIRVRDRRRIPPKSYFDDTSQWPWRIDRYPAFGDQLVRLYDLFASRIPTQHGQWDWEKGTAVRAAFNQRAAQLTADTANVLGCTKPESPLSARDVIARLQKRGRRSGRVPDLP